MATGSRAEDYKYKFNDLTILKLRGVSTKNITFLKGSGFENIAKMHAGHLLYCRVPHIVPYPFLEDPEYDESVGWSQLRNALQDRDNWILYCNNHSRIRKEFAKDKFYFVDENYKITDDEKAKEVIIVRHS